MTPPGATKATEQIGAGRYERCESRVTERNGSRPRLVATQGIELRIPKLRKGSFFPSILEPRRRIDQALHAVVMEAYVNGVSTRSRLDGLVHHSDRDRAGLGADGAEGAGRGLIRDLRPSRVRRRGDTVMV